MPEVLCRRDNSGAGLELASVVWQSDSARTYTRPATSFG
jgi:hypothetical protein